MVQVGYDTAHAWYQKEVGHPQAQRCVPPPPSPLAPPCSLRSVDDLGPYQHREGKEHTARAGVCAHVQGFRTVPDVRAAVAGGDIQPTPKQRDGLR